MKIIKITKKSTPEEVESLIKEQITIRDNDKSTKDESLNYKEWIKGVGKDGYPGDIELNFKSKLEHLRQVCEILTKCKLDLSIVKKIKIDQSCG